MKIHVRRILEQITFRSRGKRAPEITLIRVHAEDNDSSLRSLLDNLGGGLDAVQIRHPNIHDDNVGLEVLRLPHGFPSIARFADYLEVLVLFKLQA
jgi:hypothetical protein